MADHVKAPGGGQPSVTFQPRGRREALGVALRRRRICAHRCRRTPCQGRGTPRVHGRDEEGRSETVAPRLPANAAPDAPMTRQASSRVSARVVLSPEHANHPARAHRPQGQPPLPRHDELRPAHDRAGLVRDHGPGARARHQLLRHRQRLRLEEGRGRHRADRRPLARAGRRAARARSCSRPRSTARWATGRTSRASPRSTSAARARSRCAACRPTTSTSTRCTTSTATRRGTRSGRRWRRSCSRARCSTSARRTSPAGTSRRPTRRRRRGTSSGWCPSRALYNLIERTIELEVHPGVRRRTGSG